MGKIKPNNPSSPTDVSAWDWSIIGPGVVDCGIPMLEIIGMRALPGGPEPVVVRPPRSPAMRVDRLIQRRLLPAPFAPQVAHMVANLPAPVNVGQKWLGVQPPRVRGPFVWDKGRALEQGGFEWTLVHGNSTEYMDQMPEEQESTARPYDPANRLTYPVAVSANALAPDPTTASIAEGEVKGVPEVKPPLLDRAMTWCEQRPWMCWGLVTAGFFMIGRAFSRK